jgi:mobilome CxxCx(11)CxxC protein
MLKQATINRVKQQKLDALSAIHLHKKKIRDLQPKNRLIDFLTIAVPAFYLTPRLLAKGTNIAPFVDFVGEVLAGLLLVLALFKLINKWQDDEIKHAIMSRRNADTVNEADRILGSSNANNETIEQFLIRTKDVNSEDEILLIDTNASDKKESYREALKQFSPGDPIVCPVCGADPWQFILGNCQACGGTPSKSQKIN